MLTLRRRLQLSVDWKPPYILSKVSSVLRSPTQTARTPAHTAAMSGSSSPRAMALLTLEAAEYYHACVWLMLVVLVPSVRTYADTSPARTCALSTVRRAHSASLSPTAVCWLEAALHIEQGTFRTTVPHTRTHTHTPLLCQGARRLVQWRANFGSSGTLMSQRQPVRIACARQSEVLLLGTSHRTLHLHLEASVSLTGFSPQVLCCSLFLFLALLW